MSLTGIAHTSNLTMSLQRQRDAAEAHCADLAKQVAALTTLVQQYRHDRCPAGCLCRRCRRVAELLPALPYYPF